MSRRLVIIAIISTVVIVFGLSFFVMPITSVSIFENIEMDENLVIEASAFYLSPIPLIFNCAEVYYTISWWNDNENTWMEVFERPRADCACSSFYLNKDYHLTWSPKNGWHLWENEGPVRRDALLGNYKIDVTVHRDDYELEFDLRQEE